MLWFWRAIRAKKDLKSVHARFGGVDSNKPGIKINPLHKIGWHVGTCEVYLDNVEVDENDRVGEEGMGFLNVMYNFEMERLINAAGTGFAECAFTKVPPVTPTSVSPLVNHRPITR